MKLPSIKKLQNEAIKSFLRFPLAIVTGLVITVIGIVLIEIGGDLETDTFDRLMRTILALVFAFPLFGSISLIKERNNWDTDKILISNVLVAVFTILHYIFILGPSIEKMSFVQALSAFLLTIVAYLIATFAAYINKKENRGFWHYNISLIKSIALSVAYCGVLFVGIALIFASIDFLFDINIEEKTYAEAFVLIAGVLAPLAIFSQIPQDLDSLNNQKEASKLIKFLAQYILVPLLSVYTIILYAYGGKILISQDWPEGIIGWMIIIYAIIGIISILLLYPFQEKEDDGWINTFAKWFHILLIPITGLLFAAIGIRISQYAFTESRYYVMILGVWLVTLSLYLIFSKKKDLKLIPLSVSVLILVSLFGPWSAFSISKNSQEDRLKEILIQNDVLSDSGFNEPSTSTFSKTDETQVTDIIDYLSQYHDLNEVALWLNEDPQELALLNKWEQKTELFEILKVEPFPYIDRPSPYQYFRAEPSNTVKINENTYLISTVLSKYNKEEKLLPTPDRTLAKIKLTNNIISLHDYSDSALITINLNDKIKELTNISKSPLKEEIPYKDMILEGESERASATLNILSLTLEQAEEADKKEIENIEANILVRLK